MTPVEQEMLDGIKRLEDGQSQLIESQARVIDRLDHLDDCVDQTKEKVTQLQDLILSAFPDKDPTGHRLAHQVWMDKARKAAELRNAAVKKAVEWATVGALVLIVTALWEAFRRGVAG